MRWCSSALADGSSRPPPLILLPQTLDVRIPKASAILPLLLIPPVLTALNLSGAEESCKVVTKNALERLRMS